MDIKERFGSRVRELRHERGISQEALALAAGIDRTYLPGIEKGVRNVSLEVIERLATALEIPIREFFSKEK